MEPTITISDVSVVANAAAEVVANFCVTLSQATASTVDIAYTTVEGTASAGAGNYVGVPAGKLTIPAGQITATIPVTVRPHASEKLPKSFSLSITAAQNAEISRGLATATINAPTVPANTPLVGKVSIAITAGRTLVGGEYDQITVNVHPTDTVTINGVKANNIVVACGGHLTIANTTTVGQGNYGVVAWRFTDLVFENNETTGTYGFLFRDMDKTARSARVRFNRGTNINGAVDAQGKSVARQKVSFIQFQHVSVPGLLIQWNECANVRGQSAVEDCISLMNSGGAATSRAQIANNFVDGVYALPVLTGNETFSGSGIMAFDPGAAQGVAMSGFTDVVNNIVIDSENQGIAMASSNSISIRNNLLVKDGTGSQFGTVPAQVWNWGTPKPATPDSLFAINTYFASNQYNWFVHGKQIAPALDHRVVQSQGANILVATTAAEARDLWAKGIAAAGVKIGPQSV